MTFYVQYWYIEHKLLHKKKKKFRLFTIDNHQEPNNSKLDKANEMKFKKKQNKDSETFYLINSLKLMPVI